jgi:phage tail-like protein
MGIFSLGSGWSWSPGGGSGGGTGAPGRRGYTAGWFALEMDNQALPVGFVTQMDGGSFRSEPIQHQTGQDQFIAKYAGKPKYDDISIGIGMPNSSRLFNWVKSSIENVPERHGGALVGYDNFAGQAERSRRVFTDALISEITFPSLDAASNQPANISLKIAPETLTYQRGSSRLNAAQARDEAIKQKRWSCANFGLRLDGFWGQGSQRNAKIESFTIKQTIMENPAGDRLENTKWAGRVEYPNLVVTFDEGNMADWYAWFKDSSLEGKITRRTGAISWYAPDMKTELMRLNLDGVGLLNLEVERYEAGKEQIARVKATLFVETMQLQAGAGNV